MYAFIMRNDLVVQYQLRDVYAYQVHVALLQHQVVFSSDVVLLIMFKIVMPLAVIFTSKVF